MRGISVVAERVMQNEVIGPRQAFWTELIDGHRDLESVMAASVLLNVFPNIHVV